MDYPQLVEFPQPHLVGTVCVVCVCVCVVCLCVMCVCVYVYNIRQHSTYEDLLYVVVSISLPRLCF